MSASLIGRSGSSAFRLSTVAVSMSLTGSRFSSESAPRPFHHGIRGRGGTIFWTALPSVERQVQADMRTHLIRRPARDIFPPLRGTRVSSCRILSDMILQGCHAAAAACSRVQRNSVPSTQMRCMITANRRASATIAFFIPQRPCEVNRRPDGSGGGLQFLARPLRRTCQIVRGSDRAHSHREQHPVPEIRGLSGAVSAARAVHAGAHSRIAHVRLDNNQSKMTLRSNQGQK